jgi:hypothetical protein
VKRPIKNSILCHYSCEVKIFENRPETWWGPDLDPARGPPVGIAGLDNVGALTSHSPIGFHGLTGIASLLPILLTDFTKIVRNLVFRAQCTTHNGVMPFYKLDP